MAIRKATAEDLKKYVVSGGKKSGMATETRELIDGFRALKGSDKLLIEVTGTDGKGQPMTQSKTWSQSRTKLKTYLKEEEFGQVGYEYSNDGSVVFIIRKTKAA